MVREHDRRLLRTWRDRQEAMINFHPDYDQIKPSFYNTRAELLGGNAIARKIRSIFEERLPQNREGSVSRILDIAAGTGILSRELNRSGYRVVATDISQRMLTYLHEKTPAIKVQRGDMNGKLPFADGEFDGIGTMWANRFMVSQNICNEAFRLLREGGVFIWPINPGEWLDWKAQTSVFQATQPFTLARKLRKVGFSVDIVRLTEEESIFWTETAKEMNTYLVATKPIPSSSNDVKDNSARLLRRLVRS